MSWDEWEQLKADAAARGSTHMQLNQAVADGSGGGPAPGAGAGRLQSDKKAWAQAGGDTNGLTDDVTKALTKLDSGQDGLGDTAGCQSAATQKELYDSWKKYVGDVSARCAELGGLLARSGTDLSMTDADVKAELDKLKLKYQDTEPVGGQASGR
ncbi:hypothetical protein [Streptomyces sp. NK08204]|uniref:hypothetical protein n=1 Tax=Streptomyces sp. NK08204 TaxID=2873260 RepID=UPI001CED43A2|nr:hypothetical protein [Streptomyces sp. NK08204]